MYTYTIEVPYYCTNDACDDAETPLRECDTVFLDVNGTSEPYCNGCAEEINDECEFFKANAEDLVLCNCHRLPSPPTVCTHSL